MLKLVTLILRSRYSHKKQIKTDYEAQFLTNPIFNNKIKKNQLNKKTQKTTRVNSYEPIKHYSQVMRLG
jgi:hypothetical protein